MKFIIIVGGCLGINICVVFNDIGVVYLFYLLFWFNRYCLFFYSECMSGVGLRLYIVK